ncbi:MAG TPA: hypothetical protein PLC98_25605 [Anaerolineales bacterium]|nr:hypothetical protein [Anaerolineales bacterium]
MLQINDILTDLRQQLLAARNIADTDAKSRAAGLILDVCGVLVESAYRVDDRPVAGILEQLLDSARDTIHGVEWKSTIPTEDDIRKATLRA